MEANFYYILKVSFVLILMYSSYQLVIRNEKLFQLNRFLLVSELILSALFPLFYITKIVDAPIFDLTNTNAAIPALSEHSTIIALNPYLLIITLNLIGAFFLFIKLFKLSLVLKRILNKGARQILCAKVRIKANTTIEHFSFFNSIIYNPSLYSEKN